MAHCGDCVMDFSNTSNFRAHIKRKHPGKVDIWAPKLRRSHIIDVTSGAASHVCKECRKTFVSFGNLRFHVKQKHFDRLEELAPLEVKKHKCSSCDAEFEVLQNLRDHKKSHAVPMTIQCPLCEYTGPSTDTLIKHYKLNHYVEIYIETLQFESFKAFQLLEERRQELQNNRRLQRHHGRQVRREDGRHQQLMQEQQQQQQQQHQERVQVLEEQDPWDVETVRGSPPRLDDPYTIQDWEISSTTFDPDGLFNLDGSRNVELCLDSD